MMAAAATCPLLCVVCCELCAICRWRKNTDGARREAKTNAQDAVDDSDDSDSVPATVRSALADLSDDDDVFAPGTGSAQAAASSSTSLSKPGTSESLSAEESDMCDDDDLKPVPTGCNKRKRLVQADSDSE
jgi:hypothetical protein